MEENKLSKEDEESLARLEAWWRKKPEKAEPISRSFADRMDSAEPPVPKEAK